MSDLQKYRFFHKITEGENKGAYTPSAVTGSRSPSVQKLINDEMNEIMKNETLVVIDPKSEFGLDETSMQSDINSLIRERYGVWKISKSKVGKRFIRVAREPLAVLKDARRC